jgi:hypothetical protein
MVMTAVTFSTGGYYEQNANVEVGDGYVHVALLFVVVATALSVISIVAHFKNYRKPVRVLGFFNKKDAI